MLGATRNNLDRALLWSQRYTRTDMRYLARGGFWLLGGQGFQSLLALGTMSAFAYFATQETFGTYQYILSVASIASIPALPGLNSALVRAVARGHEGTLLTVARARFQWSLIGSAILASTSAWYALNANLTLALSFGVVAIILPFWRTGELFPYFWQGRSDFRRATLLDGASAAIPTAVLIGLIIGDAPIVLLMGLYLGVNAATRWLAYHYSKQRMNNSPADPEAITLGKHLSLMGALKLGADHLDKVILWHFLGPATVAIYTFALLPSQRLLSFLPIQELALPKISALGDKHEAYRGLTRKFFLMVLALIPIVAFAVLAAPLLYQLIFPAYAESVPLFQALALTALLVPFSLFESALLAQNKKRPLYILQIAPSVTRIVLYIALIPFMGVWGVVVATLAGASLRAAFSSFFFRTI